VSSRNLKNEAAYARFGLLRHREREREREREIEIEIETSITFDMIASQFHAQFNSVFAGISSTSILHELFLSSASY
jgi:hypothetical protein